MSLITDFFLVFQPASRSTSRRRLDNQKQNRYRDDVAEGIERAKDIFEILKTNSDTAFDESMEIIKTDNSNARPTPVKHVIAPLLEMAVQESKQSVRTLFSFLQACMKSKKGITDTKIKEGMILSKCREMSLWDFAFRLGLRNKFWEEKDIEVEDE